MKKTWWILVFLALAGVTSFADDKENLTLCIRGFADRVDQLAFFMNVFTNEAAAAGYNISENYNNADFCIDFEIRPDGDHYIINVRLLRTFDNFTVLSTEYLFTEVEDMLPFNQALFNKIIANFPIEPDVIIVVPESYAWRNKWLYLRASFNYPISYYALQSDGLHAGLGAYWGRPNDSGFRSMPLDNNITALPGITLGVEAHILNWMSIEPNIQLYMDELHTSGYFYNLEAGVELKFPVKPGRIFMLEPYIAGTYVIPLGASGVFTQSGYFGFGGGIQIGVRGGARGVFFLDANYRYFGDVRINNP
jgi:hypothetical protein